MLRLFPHASPRPPARGTRALLLLLFAAAFLAAAPEAWARGRTEDPLAAADRLIASQNYNEAILYITEFIRQHPERFDAAQERLKRVMEARESYINKARDLLELLSKDPTNEEKKLALIRELEALEKSPNKETRDFIQRTKDASLFVYNRAKFDEIMDRGRRLIESKRYAEASKAYIEGFALYRGEFDAGPSDAITKSAVAGLVERVKSGSSLFGAGQASLGQAAAALEAAFRSGDPAAAAAAWPRAEAAFLELAAWREAAAKAGLAMEARFSALKAADPTVPDSSFLPFAYRFTLGRSSSTLPEGVVGAMDSQWSELLGRQSLAMEASLDGLSAAAETAFTASESAPSLETELAAAAAYEKVADFAGTGLSLLGLWKRLAPTEAETETSPIGKLVLESAEASARLSHLARVSRASARLAGLSTELREASQAAVSAAAGLQAPASPSPATPSPTLSAALSLLGEGRKAIAAVGAKLEAERQPAQELAEELSRWSAAGYALDNSARIQGAYDGRLAAALARARGAELSVVGDALALEYGDLATSYQGRAASLAEGKLLLEGRPLDASGLTQRFPTRSAELLGAEGAAIAALRARIADFLGRLGKEIPYIAGSPAVQAWAEQARALDLEARGLDADRKALLARAEDQRKSAESARLEAERRLAEARRALSGEDFETARDRLGRARDRYLASLSLEERPELRALSDRELQKLGEEIVRAENDKVIRETRLLITQGKTLYFQGSFDRAEDSFLRARARWKTTNGDETDPELEYWIRLVQAALSVKSGRDVPPTAPLYPEMSQLLSLAKGYYEEGRRLLEARRKTDALQAFAAAKQKIIEVKVVFPLNEEAGVLALRIDQLIDPEAFRQVFGGRFAASRAKLESSPREAYSELQDLAAIDPRYPGLRAALDRAEILLGLRIPPANPAIARRAAELVAAARRVVDSGDRARFPFALEQLNEAIQLDPNSEAAITLKDRIQSSQGGSAQIVLSSAAEAQYLQAVALFQDGNTLQALGIVERLLTDANNKRSQKLLELYKKIQARL